MKCKLLIVLSLCCMLFCGCNYVKTEETAKTTVEKEQNLIDVSDKNIRIWTDEETGVQYIIYSYKDGYGGMGGITPRLNSVGNVMLGK